MIAMILCMQLPVNLNSTQGVLDILCSIIFGWGALHSQGQVLAGWSIAPASHSRWGLVGMPVGGSTI
jgi:hypothetical protein